MSASDQLAMIKKPRRSWWRRGLKLAGWGLLALLIVGICLWIGRRWAIQERLEEALAELDRTDTGWRLADIEAAREQIPEEDNSARVVVTAAKLLPKQWPPQEFDDQFRHRVPEELLDPDKFARLKQELDKVQSALNEAHKLDRMPRGRHHLEYKSFVLDTRLNDQQDTRRVIHLLCYDALRRDQEGDLISALKACRAALHAARSIGDEPFAISQLIRIAGVILSCQGIERILAQGEPSPEELADLQNLLKKEDGFQDMRVVARGERASLHETFTVIERGDVPLTHSFFGPRPAWEEYVYGWFLREQFRDAHPAMLAQMNRFLTIAELPWHQQTAVERALDARLHALKKIDPLAVLFIPALQKVFDASRRKHAYLCSTMSAFAAELYRR